LSTELGKIRETWKAEKIEEIKKKKAIMGITSIKEKDDSFKFSYFNGPTNYDDMNTFKVEQGNISTLIDACAMYEDELIIDLSSQCDERTKKIFELADTILIVSDKSKTARIKIEQFMRQHGEVFPKIKNKVKLITNKNTKEEYIIETEEYIIETLKAIVHLPFVESTEAYKKLADGSNNWEVIRK